MPSNEIDANTCRDILDRDHFSRLEEVPETITELEPFKLAHDAILYVVHPTRKRKKQEDGRFAIEFEPHISEPLDFSEFFKGKGRVIFDVGTLLGQIASRCYNDPKDKGGRFFRAQLSSVDKTRPNDVMIKITDV